MEEKNLREFLESVPPGRETFVKDFVVQKRYSSIGMATPQIQIQCTSEECQGLRFFDAADESWLNPEKHNNSFVVYCCRNCRRQYKTFALGSDYDKARGKWTVKKYGEDPAFGTATPVRALNLIGGELGLFVLGRRCEEEGMGIGAFAYYRRVIESQKNRIFDELIRVIGRVNPGNPVLDEIEAAKKEPQFIKAVESIKHSLPRVLDINGHNPLSLLHSALTEGMYQHSDSEYLELASSLRTVLFEFAEKLAQAIKEEQVLNAAVTRLINRKSHS